MIIKYFGHHAHFVRSEPFNLAHNLWALCSFSGCYSNFDQCCGKNISDQREDLQLRSKVLNMLDAVEEPQSHSEFVEKLIHQLSNIFLFKKTKFLSNRDITG